MQSFGKKFLKVGNFGFGIFRVVTDSVPYPPLLDPIGNVLPHLIPRWDEFGPFPIPDSGIPRGKPGIGWVPFPSLGPQSSMWLVANQDTR